MNAPAPKRKAGVETDEKHGTNGFAGRQLRGTAENLLAEKFSDSALEEEAIKIARDWKFRPAAQDGQADSRPLHDEERRFIQRLGW